MADEGKREYYRIDATVYLSANLIPVEKTDDLSSYTVSGEFNHKTEKMSSKRINISGTGISVDVYIRCEPGDVLEIKMLLPKVFEGMVVLYARAIRVESINNRFYRVGAVFLGLNDKMRTLITRFVLERERELIADRRVGWM